MTVMSTADALVDICKALRNTRIVLQWNPDFSNPHFFDPPDNSNQKLFPLLSRTLQFYHRFLELPISRTNLRFPWRFEKSGFHCSCFCVYFSRDQCFLFRWRYKTDMKVVENTSSERFHGGHISVLKHAPVFQPVVIGYNTFVVFNKTSG